MIAEIFESMDFVDLAILAESGTGFQEIARIVLNLRYNRMIERFYPRAMDVRRMLNETSSVISGSFVLEYAFYHRLWKCNDLDIYTRAVDADAWEEFFKRVGYVRQREEDEGGEEGEDEDEEVEPFYNPRIKEIRTLRRTQPDSLVDIMVSDTSNALQPLLGFWNSCLQNFATCNTFTFAYPRNTFRQKGHVTGMWRQDDRVPYLAEKYVARGFTIATPRRAPRHMEQPPLVRRRLNDHFSWSLNISNGRSGDDFVEADMGGLVGEGGDLEGVVWCDAGVLLF